MALPRVNLTSNTMQLTSGVVNLTGMLVYNTTATLGAIGIYFWNGATWVKASLPSTSAADSGKILMSNGISWVATNSFKNAIVTPLDSLPQITKAVPVSLTLILDSTIILPSPLPANTYGYLFVPGMTGTELCVSGSTRYIGSVYGAISYSPAVNRILIFDMLNRSIPIGAQIGVRCYRSSL